MFPGANAQVYYNEAGEPIGWDYPAEPEYDPDAYLAGDYDEDEDEDEDEDVATYKIVRFYADLDIPKKTIATGLTREAALAHCESPETSSTTATSIEALERTDEFGPWFDGWYKEDDDDEAS